MTSRKRPGDPDDIEAWETEISDVTPLPPASGTGPCHSSRRARPVSADEADPASARVREPFDVRVEGEHVTGRAPDTPHAAVKALARGEPRPGTSLDLHGFTRESAAREVAAFVARSRAGGCVSVRIVTGRGAVIQPAIAEWLAHPPCAPHVRAFATAPPRQGGAGAILVLLRRAGRTGAPAGP